MFRPLLGSKEETPMSIEAENRRIEEVSKGQEIAKALADGVNVMGNRDFDEAFVEHLTCRTHRTLQQSVAGLFMKVFKAWAEIADKGEGHYDLRNEATVKMAQAIRDATKDHYLPLV
jgi:hypothetical protein